MAGVGYGKSNGTSVSDSVADSEVKSHTVGHATTVRRAVTDGWAHTEGVAHTSGSSVTTSTVVTEGTAHTDGKAHAEGVAHTVGTASTSGSSNSTSVTHVAHSGNSGDRDELGSIGYGRDISCCRGLRWDVHCYHGRGRTIHNSKRQRHNASKHNSLGRANAVIMLRRRDHHLVGQSARAGGRAERHTSWSRPGDQRRNNCWSLRLCITVHHARDRIH